MKIPFRRKAQQPEPPLPSDPEMEQRKRDLLVERARKRQAAAATEQAWARRIEQCGQSPLGHVEEYTHIGRRCVGCGRTMVV